MRARSLWLAAAFLWSSATWAQTQPVKIQFKAVVGEEDFACGHSYTGIGTTKSTIEPKDLRFYVHNVRLLDETGKEVPVHLNQDGKWQLEDVVLLDFENGTGRCSNGNADLNMEVSGTVPGGHTYRGVRFLLGLPFDKNHTDITTMPPPLNLTSMSWSWNAGRKFARIEFTSTGLPHGFIFHLGSTGCVPNTPMTAPPTSCSQPNVTEIFLPEFIPGESQVVADMAMLLKDSNVDVTVKEYKNGCMSSPGNPDCAPLFTNLGLAFGANPARPQTVFRLGNLQETSKSKQQ